MKTREYLHKLATVTDTSSLRKFVTLLITGIFLTAQVLIVFFCFYLILYTTKGQVDKDLLKILEVVLQYDFYILLSGLGFITSSDLVRVIVSRGFDPTPPPKNTGWGNERWGDDNYFDADDNTSHNIKVDNPDKVSYD